MRNQRNGCRIVGSLRVSETLAGEVLSLPMFPELEPQQIAWVAAGLRESLRDLGRDPTA